jgi:predicted NUDIX family phosphoesterase
MKNERVLALPRRDIEPFLKTGFFAADQSALLDRISEGTVFLDRALAEEDESFKQIIPYAAVTHGGRVLTHRRMAKSGEARLREKRSIGFGGHINDTDVTAGVRTHLVLSGMIRELNEEVFIPGIRSLKLVGFVNDDSTPVNRVHLGIVFVVESASDHFVVNEPDQIQAEWSSPSEIDSWFESLESWSQIVWQANRQSAILLSK